MTWQADRPGLSLRISVTGDCPLRCSYCRPADGVAKTRCENLLSFEQIAQFVSVLSDRYTVKQVRLTGGDPLARPQIERLVEMLAARGVPDLALTTNGQHFAGKVAVLKRAGLVRVNISLDSLNPARFRQITGGGVLERTLAGIKAARGAGLHPIKLNAVVLRGQNDEEVTDMVRFAAQQDCEMRFLELMPIGTAAAGFEKRFVSSAEVIARLERLFLLEPLPVKPDETSRNFLVRTGAGRQVLVGFISPSSQPFCAGCWRLRLTAAGRLIGCLARPQELPLPWEQSGSPELFADAIREAVERALGSKRRNDEFAQPRHMVEIGG